MLAPTHLALQPAHDKVRRGNMFEPQPAMNRWIDLRGGMAATPPLPHLDKMRAGDSGKLSNDKITNADIAAKDVRLKSSFDMAQPLQRFPLLSSIRAVYESASVLTKDAGIRLIPSS